MQSDLFTYPQYRKYVGINTWYKIESAVLFVEITQVGQRFVRHEVEAKQHPEKLRIQDMLHCHEGAWGVIDQSVFDGVLKEVE